MTREVLQGYDWEEAFKYATPVLVMPECAKECVSTAPFNIADVAAVYGCDEGENEVDSWVVAGRLADGRNFFLSAWCDYTGWG